MHKEKPPSPKFLASCATVQAHARAERFSEAENLISQMARAATKSGAILELALVHALHGDVLSGRRRFPDAFAAFDLAEKHAGKNEWLRLYVETQRLVVMMRKDPTDERLLDSHTDHIASLRSLGDRTMLADVLSNTGVLFAQRARNTEAASHFAESEELYRRGGREDKADDSLAAWAGQMRATNQDEEAVKAYRAVLHRASARGDLPAIARVGGDLARTLLCILEEVFVHTQHLDHPQALELSKMASSVVAAVDAAERELWKQAAAQSHSLDARLARGLELFNNVETALILDVLHERPADVLARSTRTKSRILAEDVVGRLMPGIEACIREHPEVGAGSNDACGSGAIHLLVENIAHRSGERLVAIDHFGMSGNRLCVTLRSGPGAEICESMIWGWDGDIDDESGAGALHGTHQVREPTRRLKIVLDAFEKTMGRVPFLFPETVTCAIDAGVREVLAEDLDAIRPHLTALGDFFFPTSLREALRKADIQHVILSPDPRLFHVPWYALEFSDGGSLIDEPWSLSLTPTLSLLYAAVGQPRTMSRRVAVASPVSEVTTAYGGQEVVDYLTSTFSAKSLVNDEATLARWGDAVRSAGLAQVVTHGDTTEGVPGVLPTFSDGLWLNPISPPAEQPCTLVSIACRTGSVATMAQDVFGLVPLAVRSGIATTIAPIIVVDGMIALEVMKPFYAALKAGATVGDALRTSARAGRQRFVHPALWGAFLCVGDHALRLDVEGES